MRKKSLKQQAKLNQQFRNHELRNHLPHCPLSSNDVTIEITHENGDKSELYECLKADTITQLESPV